MSAFVNQYRNLESIHFKIVCLLFNFPLFYSNLLYIIINSYKV